jgi:tRNA(Ile2) C34 agmatinyltransferase TiaS
MSEFLDYLFCLACGGELSLLGYLGRHGHFRCRDCGLDQSMIVPDGE